MVMDGGRGKSIDVRRNRKRFLLYAFGFFLNFSAYVSVRNLQSSVNIEGGLGTISIAITYLVCAVFTMFCAPAIVRTVGPKRCLLFSELSYIVYVIANLYPTYYTLIPAAVLLGVGEAVMWISISLLNVYYAFQYAGARKHPWKENVFYVNLHSGYFFTAMQGCQVFGNLISYIILYAFATESSSEQTTVAQNTTTSPPENSYQFCGANDCQDQDAIDGSISQYVPAGRTTIIILFSFLAALCVVGQILHCFFLPSHAYRNEDFEDIDCDTSNDTQSKSPPSSNRPVPEHNFLQSDTHLNGEIPGDKRNTNTTKGIENFGFDKSPLDDMPIADPSVIHRFFLPGQPYRSSDITIEELAKENKPTHDGSSLKEFPPNSGVPHCFFISGQPYQKEGIAIKDLCKGYENFAYDEEASEGASSSTATAAETKSKGRNQKIGLWSQYRTALIQTFTQMKDRRQILLVPMCLYVGFFESFVYSELTRAYSACVMGVATVGLCMAAYGLSDAILSWIVGRFGAKWGRTPFFVVSTIIDIGTFSYCLFWDPNLESSWSIYLVFFALGVTDGIWQTLLNVAHLEYFQSNHDVAIAVWNLYITVAFTIQFGWSTLLCVNVKIYIQLCLLVLSLVSYGFAERINRKKRKPAASLERAHL